MSVCVYEGASVCRACERPTEAPPGEGSCWVHLCRGQLVSPPAPLLSRSPDSSPPSPGTERKTTFTRWQLAWKIPTLDNKAPFRGYIWLILLSLVSYNITHSDDLLPVIVTRARPPAFDGLLFEQRHELLPRLVQKLQVTFLRRFGWTQHVVQVHHQVTCRKMKELLLFYGWLSSLLLDSSLGA